MLDLNFVRNNLEFVKKKVEDKKSSFDIENFKKLDAERRGIITETEALQSSRKKLSKEIGMMRRDGKDSSALEAESVAVAEKIGGLNDKLQELEEAFKDILLNIPNMYDDSVPVGQDEADNEVVRVHGEAPELDFEAKPHWDLGELNEGLDFARAAKITGSRFTVYRKNFAKLERVLISFMLEKHTSENGYMEILPPFMVNDQSLIGTGNLPKFKDDLYKIEGENYYLVPTAEVPLTNIHRDEVLEEKELPVKYAAYTPCFRSEAGSHGRDVRGIIRQHQFNKVELLHFVKPEDSFQQLEELLGSAESILKDLGLHYRVVKLCTGDLSFSSAKTYDIEVWMPARNGYVEISSCSNFLDFQARRARIKYKNVKGKKEFLHTLNGSGLAIGRTVAAIMENYQEDSGRIRIPEALKGYFNGQQYL